MLGYNPQTPIIKQDSRHVKEDNRENNGPGPFAQLMTTSTASKSYMPISPARKGTYGTAFYNQTPKDKLAHEELIVEVNSETGNVTTQSPLESKVDAFGIPLQRRLNTVERDVDSLSKAVLEENVRAGIRPDYTNKQHTYAQAMGRLYGTGTNSVLSTAAYLAEEYSKNHHSDEGVVGVRRSALQLVLAGAAAASKSGVPAGTKVSSGSIIPPTHATSDLNEQTHTKPKRSQNRSKSAGTGITSSHIPSYLRETQTNMLSPVHSVLDPTKKGMNKGYKADNSNWNVTWVQPPSITATIQTDERLPGGKYYISPGKMKNDYADPMTAEPLGEIGAYPNPTSNPRFWPEHVGYTKNDKARPHAQGNPRHLQATLNKACSKSALKKGQTNKPQKFLTEKVSQSHNMMKADHNRTHSQGKHYNREKDHREFSPENSVDSSLGFGGSLESGSVGEVYGSKQHYQYNNKRGEVNGGLFGGGSWVSEDGATVEYARGANEDFQKASRRKDTSAFSASPNLSISSQQHVHFDEVSQTSASQFLMDKSEISLQSNSKRQDNSESAGILKDIIIDDVAGFGFDINKWQQQQQASTKPILKQHSHRENKLVKQEGSVTGSLHTVDTQNPYDRPPLKLGRDTSHDHPIGFGRWSQKNSETDDYGGNSSITSGYTFPSQLDESVMICGKLTGNDGDSTISADALRTFEFGVNTALQQTAQHGKFLAARAAFVGENHKYGLSALQKEKESSNLTSTSPLGHKHMVLQHGVVPVTFIDPKLRDINHNLATHSVDSLTTNTLQLSEPRHVLVEPLPAELHMTPQERKLANIAALKQQTKEKNMHKPFGEAKSSGSSHSDKNKLSATEIEWSSLAGKGNAGKIIEVVEEVDKIELPSVKERSDSVEDESDDWDNEEHAEFTDKKRTNASTLQQGRAQRTLITKKDVVLPRDKRFDEEGNLIYVKQPTMSNITGEKPPGGQGRGASTSTNAEFYKPGYHDQGADHVHVLTDKHAGNPFRPTPEQSLHFAYKANASVAVHGTVSTDLNTNLQTTANPNPIPNPRNPLVYRPEVTYTTANNLSIVIKNDRTTGGRVLAGKQEPGAKSGTYLRDPQTGQIAINDIPTRGEIQKALSHVARKALLGYDTRIVETGAVLRALVSHKHPTPGLPAILDLHRAFIQAASLNPDPWLLKREQLSVVIQRKIPWLEADSVRKEKDMNGSKRRAGWAGCGGKDDLDAADESSPAGDSHSQLGNQGVIRRLVSAYDPQGTGLVRFVRLSVALVCCCKPDMANLISMLQGMERKRREAAAAKAHAEKEWDLKEARAHGGLPSAEGVTAPNGHANKKQYPNKNYLHTSTDSHSHIHDPGDVIGLHASHSDAASVHSDISTATAYRNQHEGEIYLLKLIHGLYEDCEGAHDPSNSHSASPTKRSVGQAGMGIRFDHIAEALSCCCTSVEEEIHMNSLTEQYMLQPLFDQCMKQDDVTNSVFGSQDDNQSNSEEEEEEEEGLGLDQDFSSNFTALSRFTPAEASVASFYKHGGVRSTVGYQPRWPEYSRGVRSTGMSTSLTNIGTASSSSGRQPVRAATDRTSGTGIYSASAQAVAKFMNSSREDTFGGQQYYTHTKSGPHDTAAALMSAKHSIKGLHAHRGGDSIAWDDDSLTSAGASLQSTTRKGPKNENKTLKGKRKKQLSAAKILKYRNLRSVLNLKRVSQDDFINTLVSHTDVINEFHRQLLNWRSLTGEYIREGSISFEDSIVEDSSYGTRNNRSIIL